MSLVNVLTLVVPLIVLVLLCMRGVNPILAGICAALATAIIGGMDLYSAMTGDYMQGFVDFLKTNWFVFFFGCVYGEIMRVSGAAESIANFIVNLIGKKYALFALPITTGLLMYGGINGLVVIFTVFPIFVQVFKETNTSRTLIPCLYFIGAGSWANCGPGTPQILNLVTTRAYDVDAAAAPLAGIVGAGTMGILGLVWFNHLVKKSKARGEVFNPEGLVDDYAEELEKRASKKLPSPFLSILPLLVCVICLNIKMGGENIFKTEVALLIACVAAIICNIKFVVPKEIVKHVTTGCTNSFNIISATCGVMGFATVIKAAPAFQALVDLIPSINLPPLVSLMLATNIFCAITGTASGSASIVANTLGPIYLKLGLDPALAARVMVCSATAFDTVPHNGTLVASIKMSHETHATCYKYMFQCSVVIPLIGAIASIVAGMMFY